MLEPNNSLLEELDSIKFKFPRSYSIISTDMEPFLPAPTPHQEPSPSPIPDDSPLVYLNPEMLYAPDNLSDSSPIQSTPTSSDPLPDLSLDSDSDAAVAYLSGRAINRHLLDVPANAIKTAMSCLTKQPVHDQILDIGQSFIPYELPPGHRSQSDEQSVLKEL